MTVSLMCLVIYAHDTDSFVVRVRKDDLVILVNTILVDPVRVQNTEVATSLPDSLLRDALKTSLRLDLVHTLTDGLAVGGTYMSCQSQSNVSLSSNVPLGTCFLRFPLRIRIR